MKTEPDQDALAALSPFLMVRPEIDDFCRFGGNWESIRDAAGPGWAQFHIVARGQCVIERTEAPPLPLSPYEGLPSLYRVEKP